MLNNLSINFVIDKKSICIIILSVFFGIKAYPQNSDFGIWGSLGIQKKINPFNSIEFSQQLITRDNTRLFDKTFSELALNNKRFKFFRTTIGYRYIVSKRDIFQIENASRLFSDFNFIYNLSSLKVNYRIRIQNQYVIGKGEFFGNSSDWVFRQRGMLEYQTGRRLFPAFSIELFHQIQNFIPQYFYNQRFRLLVVYDFDERNQIQMFYQFERKPLLTSNVYVLGISYGINI